MIISEESRPLDGVAYFEATASFDHSERTGFNGLWFKILEMTCSVKSWKVVRNTDVA